MSAESAAVIDRRYSFTAPDRDAVTTAGNDLKRVDPEERVAAHALTALHALEQEAVWVRIRAAPVLRRKAEERGNGTQHVRDNGAIDRHHIAAARQALE